MSSFKMFYVPLIQLLLISIYYAQADDNIYNFSALDIDGRNVSFDKYKGHPLLIVNVASDCLLTETNYAQLNDLFTKYEKQGLRIAAFPSNSFNQEPGNAEQIKQFVNKKNVKFDVYAKVEVNGENAHPIYEYLKKKQPGSIPFFHGIKWNFTKFLVNKDGKPVERYLPTTSPSSIEDKIKSLLSETPAN